MLRPWMPVAWAAVLRAKKPWKAYILAMLVSTPHGDTYTFPELDSMLRKAGFSRSELYPQPLGDERLIISHK